MGVYNTMQSVGLFSGGALGGLLFQHFGFNGVFAFCSVLIGFWFVLAAVAPAPAPVKNVVLPVGKAWHERQEQLHSLLIKVAGVVAVSFSADGETIFIKALQQGFDEAAVKKILLGANECL